MYQMLLDGSTGGSCAGAFFFPNIVVQDVIAEVLRLYGSRSAGCNGIYMAQLLDVLEVLAPIFTNLFNDVTGVLFNENTGVFSDSWKKSIVSQKRCSPVSHQTVFPLFFLAPV